MQQDYKIKWNDWSNVFQSALSKNFQEQKFLDAILIVEDGNHMIQCHKIVLDSCSEYFSNIFKNKFLEDKNTIPVICLPKEIKLWEMQAILSYMYNGEVSVSQEGLSGLVKCAEILKVKGLCGTSSVKCISDSENKQQNVKVEKANIANEEIKNFETENQKQLTKEGEKDNPEISIQQTDQLIRVKQNLQEVVVENKRSYFFNSSNSEEGEFYDEKNASESITDESFSKSISNNDSDLEETIVCSPELTQYIDDEKEDSYRNKRHKCDSNLRVYELVSDKNEMLIDEDEDKEMENSSNFVISKVESQYENFLDVEQKSTIAGLFLRNPRGNQIRNYDVNALYSALEDVRNGISIYRAAQTYSIPRKTLRNWMKRLHIKSHFPMPKQLQQAAQRKKCAQNSNSPDEANIKIENIEIN